MLLLRVAAVPAKRLYSNAAAAMGDSAKIADLSITTAPNGPVVKYSDLWKNHRCVIVFFRRFG